MCIRRQQKLIAIKIHEMETIESKALAETFWSVENNKQAIFSDEFRFKQNYRKVSRFSIRKKPPTGPKMGAIKWISA